ncbi:sulfate ABC transporter permease subunit CysT [Synechococcus sp. PCC 6312]|uniref:sulfate ABC transporter permease subunit CysT n=1 Tax=Synechococcus sp. (strain ATCC 27167 / PCC 6312) TaxID=195253 RepID=UPI00029F35D1|nr:sulfate ABC transporter permease subunit CysT [Synechococcus sp. PCC 6312]AFY61726.1 sulfate ABC transporter, permease protein CysT [Synechococcus sp. PCC 6312]
MSSLFQASQSRLYRWLLGWQWHLNQRVTQALVWVYLLFILVLPLSSLFWKASQEPLTDLWTAIAAPAAWDAYKLTLTTALIAATINTVFGLILAWILTRYSFPGKRIADALIDLPFALPGVVAGITLVALYGPGGIIGQVFDPGNPLGDLLEQLGLLEVNLTASVIGVTFAQVYVTLPFVVRILQPALLAIEPEVEEVAMTLGARPRQLFWRIILPQSLNSLLTGFALVLARAIGEYGVVVILSGNIPYQTLVSTVYIYQRIEEFQLSQATAVAIVLLIMSVLLLAVANWCQGWSRPWDAE